MKSSRLAVLALCACAAGAHAQTVSLQRLATPGVPAKPGFARIDVSTLLEPGMADAATGVFGFPGKHMGLEKAGDRRASSFGGIDRDALGHRAWGMSIGLSAGPIGLRIAHQNKNVAKIAPATDLGNRMDARNSTLAASVDIGLVKAYTAYSANRGWGSSPLWNPDNPYGASMAATPSTDSRDVLVGLAMPMGKTTLLTSFVRKNDRNLANRDVDQLAFGGTYATSRRTDFYTALSLIRPRNGAAALGGASLASSKGSALNVGMRHAF
jgi:predicted porin